MLFVELWISQSPERFLRLRSSIFYIMLSPLFEMSKYISKTTELTRHLRVPVKFFLISTSISRSTTPYCD